jgi:tetratricopeptide (TPR) repeat protein
MKLVHKMLPLHAAALFLAGAGTALAVDRLVHRAPLPDVRASETLIDRGELPPAEQVALMRAVAETYLERRDWRNAIAWAQRFVKAGGAEGDVRPLMAEAYFRSGDYANAARELQWEMLAAERAGKPPGEDRLRLLQTCYTHLNDGNAVAWSLEKLVTYYPKREYWAELLDRTQVRPDFGEALAMDVNRLRLHTGVLPGAVGYLRLASQAQQAGFPAEAKAVLEQGIARGVLGTGPDAASHRQLFQKATQQAIQQQRYLAQPEPEAAAERSREGLELVELGYAHVTHGNFDKGLELMERGLRKGGTFSGKPQYARLHLGIAYFLAGQKEKAIGVFKAVGGKHGAADMGRIWAIHVRNSG